MAFSQHQDRPAHDAFAPAGFRLSAVQSRFAAMAATVAALLLLLVTLRPFGRPPVPGQEIAEGDPVNQIGFLIAGALAVLCLSTLADRRVLRLLIAPSWVALLAVLVVSTMITPDPATTMRALVLTIIGMLIAASVPVLPKSEADFRAAVTFSVLIVLALAYASVFLLPQLAVHQAAEVESQHAGLWRGHYTHKNLAGPIMSVIAMYGIYCFRSGARLSGAVITVLATIFVVQTGAKTTLGFLPLAVGIVFLRPVFGSAALVAVTHVAVLTSAFALTIGTVLFDRMATFATANLSDPTYTGRTAIWDYAIDAMRDAPWLGHGFYNFWRTPTILNQERNFEEVWDIRGVITGHSNYIDMPLLFGIIGSAVIFWVLLAAPMIDYIKASQRQTNRRLADFFMMVVIFMSLLSLMETFYFNRTDTVWLLMVVAIVGLRLLSRLDLRAHAPGLPGFLPSGASIR